MKKNFLKFMIVFLSFLFIGSVCALTAKAPSEVPAKNAILYGTVDDTFDFSKISFATRDGGTVTGKSEIRKIMLAAGYADGVDGGTPSLDNNWFTAYCLDGSLKYPLNNFSRLGYNASSTDKARFELALEIALSNKTNSVGTLYTAFQGAKGYTLGPIINFEGKSEWTDTDYTDNLNTILAGNPVTVKVTEVSYSKPSGDLYTLNTEKLYKANNNHDLEVEISLANILFNLYTTDVMPNSIDYNHALWIIEHTYPTLDIETALKEAGASYETLKSEIVALHEGETLSEAALTDLVENYVYFTVQYAIWKIYDGLPGTSLGDSLTGSTQLNLLYQYLIQSRTVYASYGNSYSFTNDISLAEPSPKKTIFKETDTTYVYGPYSIKDSVLSLGDATIEVTNTDKKGIKIIDADGNEISTVHVGENFYIQTSKKEKTANVDLKITSPNGITFSPDSNRGRIYYSNYALAQNVVTGGKVSNVDISKTFAIVTNPKTGVENVGILLIITLISFTLGYLVLNIKNKPVQLNG